MLRTLFAAAVAFSLFAAVPTLACDDCKNCPSHKGQVAQADKKDDKAKDKVACPCSGGKECKCGKECTCACSHCHKEKKDEKKT